MQYWNVLKYALIGMLVVILGVAWVLQPTDTAVQPIPNQASQPNQPKFNF